MVFSLPSTPASKLLSTPASSYSLVGRGLCTQHDAPLHPYVRSFNPFNILDVDSHGNKDAVTAGLSMPMDGGALAKALCDATPDCGYVGFYVNENNQYEAQNYFMYHKNITLDLTPDPGLDVCDGVPADCNQPECLKREEVEEEECTICPKSVDIFDECPSLSSESECDANAKCGWCSDHCRVSCTCNDDETTSLYQACDYNSDGEPTTVVERWPRVIHLGFPLKLKRWAPECTCGDPDGWVGPKDHIELGPKVLGPFEWIALHEWLSDPAAMLLSKLSGWGAALSLQRPWDNDAQASEVSKAHYVGSDDLGHHGGVAVGNPGIVEGFHAHVPTPFHEGSLVANPGHLAHHEHGHPLEAAPHENGHAGCNNRCMDMCEPINPGDMDDDFTWQGYCACLQSCGCGEHC